MAKEPATTSSHHDGEAARLSDRCGLSTAEKIGGSSSGSERCRKPSRLSIEEAAAESRERRRAAMDGRVRRRRAHRAVVPLRQHHRRRRDRRLFAGLSDGLGVEPDAVGSQGSASRSSRWSSASSSSMVALAKLLDPRSPRAAALPARRPLLPASAWCWSRIGVAAALAVDFVTISKAFQQRGRRTRGQRRTRRRRPRRAAKRRRTPPVEGASRRSSAASPPREPEAEGRARLHEPVHAARSRSCSRRRRPTPASTRRRRRCSRAPTRRRRWWRSARTKVTELIRTIGLYRTQGAGTSSRCRGSSSPSMAARCRATREALETLPGVGRKTANVVLNIAFGEPTIAVDTHIFRVANRTGIAPGARSARGRGRARARRAGRATSSTPITG